MLTPARLPARRAYPIRYVILNDTSFEVEFKQRGTPDPGSGVAFGFGRRFAGKLAPKCSTAFHWDDAAGTKQLVLRPGGGGDWEWSGGCTIPDHEEYFGLRVRRARQHGVFRIIPVNIAVGAKGVVLITLKSAERSAEPYRVENNCRDLSVRFKQADWRSAARRGDSAWEDWQEVGPLSAVPYAWDEPALPHVVAVHASFREAPLEEEPELHGSRWQVRVWQL